MTSNRIPMSVRTTETLRTDLDRAAKVSGRSLAQEVEFRLENSFSEDRMRQVIREELAASRERDRPISAMMDGRPIKIHVTGPSDRLRY